MGPCFERLADSACSHCTRHNRDRLWELTDVPSAAHCAAVCAGRLAVSGYGKCAFFSHSKSSGTCHLCLRCENHSFVETPSSHNRTRLDPRDARRGEARRGTESWRRRFSCSGAVL